MDNTIVAIATSLLPSAIAIIRVNGNEAIRIVNSIFKGDNLLKAKTHTIHYGYIKDNKEIIDEVLIMLMKAPKTYTREDMVEINCHGGIVTIQKIMELLLKKGAILAEPGEFTKRAFLNGRINLLEAESVNDLITAKTKASQKMALNNVKGILTKKIRNIREKLITIISHIEVNIDYPEYVDEEIITKKMLNDFLNEIKKDLQKLILDSQNGRLIKEGINIAIIGRPNVGKSSILNALIDEEKAIVTNIPGTTRDIVEGSISLNGVKFNFFDTAGIRDTKNAIEKIGVIKSKKQADIANLVLIVLNNNEKITKEELELIKSYPQDREIIFINKTDLKEKISLTSLKDYPIIRGNTKKVNGLDELKNKIIEIFNLKEIVTNEMSYLSNIRQIDLVNKANNCIISAHDAFKNNVPVDIIEIDLRKAWDLLGELIGENYTDELIDNIFSKFCLGK